MKHKVYCCRCGKWLNHWHYVYAGGRMLPACADDRECWRGRLELNRISYNGRAAKLDLRRWDRSGGQERMLKGITLSDEEADELKAAMSRMGEDSYGERGV